MEVPVHTIRVVMHVDMSFAPRCVYPLDYFGHVGMC